MHQVTIFSKFFIKIIKTKAELATLKSKGPRVTEADMNSVAEVHSKMISEWRRRKRIAMNIIDTIAEGYPSSKKQLMVSCGNFYVDFYCILNMPNIFLYSVLDQLRTCIGIHQSS
ncbi:unnamed protein product [Heterobilharzia americana]|nr:unnamed protein product [Heterobilharzia americana]